MKLRLAAFTVGGLLAIPAGAFAWNVTFLHPTNAAYSSASWTDTNFVQYGDVRMGNTVHASRWNQSAGSWTAIGPAGATSSRIFGARGYAVGEVVMGGVTRAWAYGSGGGDMHPTGAWSSTAHAVGFDRIVGTAVFGGQERAGFWTGGGPFTWNSLHPTGAVWSRGFAVIGSPVSKQYGVATFAGAMHAAMWQGTAASFVDLHPAGAFESAVYGGTTLPVGFASIGGNQHAGYWDLTNTFRDVNPVGSARSEAYSESGGVLAGWAMFGPANEQAALMTLGGHTNLHTLLPGHYSKSMARHIWHAGSGIYVTGEAFNSVTNQTEAVLWFEAVPEPGSMVAVVVGLAALAGRRRAGKRVGK